MIQAYITSNIGLFSLFYPSHTVRDTLTKQKVENSFPEMEIEDPKNLKKSRGLSLQDLIKIGGSMRDRRSGDPHTQWIRGDPLSCLHFFYGAAGEYGHAHVVYETCTSVLGFIQDAQEILLS